MNEIKSFYGGKEMLKKIIFFVLISMTIFCSCEQKIEFVGKNGVLYEKGSAKPYTGKKIDYYESGKIEVEMQIVDGLANGNYITYYEDGTTKETGVLKNNMFNSEYKKYYPNGNLQLEYFCSNGVINGIVKGYYETGKLKAEISYKPSR